MIRRHRDEDTDAVVSVWRRASAVAHPFLAKAFLDQEEENVRNVYMPLAEVWVLEADGGIIGFIALLDTKIGGLFLDPDHHGRGYGRMLVDRAVAEKGAVTVEVFKANAIGRRFYDRYGFRLTEEFTHEASGQPTLRMVFTPE